MQNQYDHFEFIDETGRALDNFLNEYRDEIGQCIYVPANDWHLFKQVNQNERI